MALKQWLSDHQMAPTLMLSLISGLQSWYQGSTLMSSDSLMLQWQDDQDEIGWGFLLDGWLSEQWQQEQDCIWAQIKSRKPS